MSSLYDSFVLIDHSKLANIYVPLYTLTVHTTRRAVQNYGHRISNTKHCIHDARDVETQDMQALKPRFIVLSPLPSTALPLVPRSRRRRVLYYD
jgi:hypothetical protein